jgi:hypothetical protein
VGDRKAKIESLVCLVKKASFFIVLGLPLFGGVLAEDWSSGKVSAVAVKPAATAQQPGLSSLVNGSGIYGVDRVAVSSRD